MDINEFEATGQLMDELIAVIKKYHRALTASEVATALSSCAGQIIAQSAPNEEELQLARQVVITYMDQAIEANQAPRKNPN
jgi:phosphoribosylformylglycinamidine (FGAM) synthase-like amidotransferase family enzyme